MMRVGLERSLFSRTLFNHSIRQDITQIVMRAQHTVQCQAIGTVSPLYNHSTKHGNICAFPARGTQGNKPHTPGHQYNDPHHHITTARCTATVKSATASKYLLHFPLQHLNYQTIIQAVPRYQNWLLRINATVVLIFLL
jgi:hypothetical protein